MRRSVNGILLLDKPIDISSNGALQRVKHLYNAKKAGHTGSLDPIATGMLPICFGEATKFSQFLLDSNKSYDVIAQLGAQTTTGDSEGEIIATQPIVDITVERVTAVMQKYLGQIEQIPPMFSAIKVKGRPLYELARKGIEIERKPRNITIFSMDIVSITADQIRFHVHCSKGTYIRTLVEDMGRDLGCLGYVIGLRRTRITPYGNAAVMYTLSDLIGIMDRQSFDGLDACLLPVQTAVDIFPAVKLSTSAAFYLRMGQPVRAPFELNTQMVRLLAEDETFIGIGEVLGDGRVKPLRLVS